jgi:hypothetical protein
MLAPRSLLIFTTCTPGRSSMRAARITRDRPVLSPGSGTTRESLRKAGGARARNLWAGAGREADRGGGARQAGLQRRSRLSMGHELGAGAPGHVQRAALQRSTHLVPPWSRAGVPPSELTAASRASTISSGLLWLVNCSRAAARGRWGGRKG